MMDGDEEATDPQVDAQELLSRMKWLSCRIPPLRRRHRKAVKLVKSIGEGDWGGEDDLEKPDVRSHPSYTDWLLDFVGAGPPIVSSGSDNDNVTRWEQLDQGPQPGPSTRPTSAQDLPAGLLPVRGEAPSQTLTEPDISRVRDSPSSVSGQPPTEPDLPSSSSVGNPKTQAKATVPRIQPHPTSQQSRELQRTSPHLRPRDLESEKEKPPSKVTKSVRWVKSLLGFGSDNDKDHDEPMTEGDDPEQSPTTGNPGDCDNNPGVPISSDSESEEEMEQSPDTTRDMDQSLDTSGDME